MRSRWLVCLLCLVALGSVLLTTGCSVSSAQRRNRILTIRTDRERIKREWDWILGVEDPSILYDYTMPPYW